MFALLLIVALTNAACGGGAVQTEMETEVEMADPLTAPPALPATVVDATGHPVTVRDISRVVSVGGDVTETIFALDMGGVLVGVDTSSTFPAETDRLPKVGYQRRLSAEGVLSLAPTLVLASAVAGPADALQQIRDAGVPVVIVPDGVELTTALDKVTVVAAALGVPERGRLLAERIRAELDRAQARAAAAPTRPRVLFLYLRGAQTQLIHGAGTPADSLIRAAGALNAAAEAGIEGRRPLTPEALVAAAPEVLLVLERGLESVGGIDGLLAIPGIAQTPAGRARRVIVFDDLYLLGLGPRVGDALNDLVTALHGPEGKE